jgi:hypothetical protein
MFREIDEGEDVEDRGIKIKGIRRRILRRAEEEEEEEEEVSGKQK